MKPPTADLAVDSTLRHCELLEPLSDAQIAELAARARMITLREGEPLFEQNAEANDLFVVANGRLAIRLSTPAGRVIEVEEVGHYCLSGWASMVAPHAYIADAHALEDSTVLAIASSDAEEVFLSEPAAGYAVMKQLAGVMSGHLRDIKEHLIEVLES